jgi:hypothetical protein
MLLTGPPDRPLAHPVASLWQNHSAATALVDLTGCNIPVSDSILTLGITLSFASHVSQLCKQSLFHIRPLRHIIRHCLTVDMANATTVAIVQSRLNNSNRIHVHRHNSTQLNWTVSRHLLKISFIHVCKTRLNSTQHSSTQLNWSF